jgi:hypothetical protein
MGAHPITAPFTTMKLCVVVVYIECFVKPINILLHKNALDFCIVALYDFTYNAGVVTQNGGD